MLRPSPTLVLALLLTATPITAAAASEPTPSEISVARRLFEEGKAAEDARRFREAAEKFRKAVLIKDTPGIRFHLARCEEEQGALVEALVEYDRARELLESGIKAPDVERLLPDARQRVQSQLAFVTLRLPEGVNEARVELDGKPLASSILGVPIPVNPGKHRLSATARGRTSFAAEVELGVGDNRQLAIDLPAEAAPTATQTAAAPPARPALGPKQVESDGETVRTVVLVSEASLFAAGLTSGIVFAIAQGDATDRYEKANELVLSQVGGSDPQGVACSVPREGCAELETARQDEKRNGTIATVGFVTAGVSALAFGLTLALWKTDPPARINAGVGPNHATLLISTSF
jgi:tetratricopeptide (TPR) repeat protein